MKKSAGLDVIAGLALVCVFAVCVLLTLSAGAGIYRDVSGVMEQQYTSRTALGYVTTKLHQSDARGAVSVTELEGLPALCVREELEGTAYVTYLYCWDGSIMELFCPESEMLASSEGERVVDAQSLHFTRRGDLLRIDCVTDGGAESAWVSLVTGLEGA